MRDIPFYYNRVSGKCTWEQPQDWVFADRKAFERPRKCGSGFTEEENQMAIRLQTMWAGRQTRRALRATMDGAKIMKKCEFNYLQDPRNLTKMTHYCLYLHTVGKDPDRARPMYQTLQSHDRARARRRLGVTELCDLQRRTGEDDWPNIEEARAAPWRPEVHYMEIGTVMIWRTAASSGRRPRKIRAAGRGTTTRCAAGWRSGTIARRRKCSCGRSRATPTTRSSRRTSITSCPRSTRTNRRCRRPTW